MSDMSRGSVPAGASQGQNHQNHQKSPQYFKGGENLLHNSIYKLCI